MLLGIHPQITPDLLKVLAQMGHGDEIVIADANFPATRSARSCPCKQVIQYPGFDAAQVVDLITDLMPLDAYSDYAALRMEIDDAPNSMGQVHRDVFNLLKTRSPKGATLGSISRERFYSQALSAYAVVQCSEERPFGCFILRKGVIV